MNREGLRQAEERLERLRQAEAVLRKSGKNLSDKESAWLDFIQNHGTLYSKLEQASKGDFQSQKWFYQKKNVRKNDALLVYLHHARNVGEHTIQKTSTQARFAISGTATGRFGKFGMSFDDQGNPYAVVDGDIADIKILEDEIILAVAIDRGVKYHPPREHLGIEIDGKTAGTVAELGLEYFERMIKEAFLLTRN